MKKAFMPDRMFRRISDIDIERDLIGKGTKLVILDIDGTVKNRLLRRAPKDTVKWINQCRENDLFVCLVSNDRRKRHLDFAAAFDLPLFDYARKPTPHSINFILNEYSVEGDKAVLIGNNLFTDILCAHAAGIKGYWVRPIESTKQRKYYSAS